jgi:Ca-activated chloride channel family protein
MLLVLPSFRRGWILRTATVVGLLAFASHVPSPSLADGMVTSRGEVVGEVPSAEWFFDLWLTKDQQGRLAFEDRKFGEAVALFNDPMWRGVAAYRAGGYGEAAASFSRVLTADGLFNMANALVKARDYRRAVEIYRQALEREPAHKAAQNNLEIARAIIAHLADTREQTSTGDQDDLGADDVMFDLESGEGAERMTTQADQLKIESAKQWMREVDTRTSDFLRTRFALEASARQSGDTAP